LDAEYDAVDGSSDEFLSATTKKKAGLGQKEADIHPLRENGLTLVRVHMPRILFLILEHQV